MDKSDFGLPLTRLQGFARGLSDLMIVGTACRRGEGTLAVPVSRNLDEIEVRSMLLLWLVGPRPTEGCRFGVGLADEI